jgi:hypothetical protein
MRAMILPTTTRRITRLRGDLFKMLSPSFLALNSHPNIIDTRSRSTTLNGYSLLILFISGIMGTIEIKNKKPASNLNRFNNMTGKEST